MKTQKKSSTKKNAIIASAAMVLVAAASLTTASYAWFVNSTTATVGEMNVQVSTGESLLVAPVYNGTYAASISEEQLWSNTSNILTKSYNHATFTNAANEPRIIHPVTPTTITSDAVAQTNGEFAFSKLQQLVILSEDKDYTADAGTTYEAATNVAANVDSYFLKFDLYLRANFPATDTTGTAIENDIVLDLTSFGVDTNYAGTRIYGTSTDATQQMIVKSLRYGFVVSTVNASGTATYANQAILAPDATQAAATYPKAYVDTAKKYKSYKVKEGANLTKATAGIAAANDPENDLVLVSDADTNQIYQVRVYVWIEGNDKDNFNEVSASKFASKLVFSLKDTIATTADNYLYTDPTGYELLADTIKN